jgi:hypothetical protein
VLSPCSLLIAVFIMKRAQRFDSSLSSTWELLCYCRSVEATTFSGVIETAAVASSSVIIGIRFGWLIFVCVYNRTGTQHVAP